MSLASSKYDVMLNGAGYTLLAESYRKKAQQPFTARFATGDPGYGDLSFWQFLTEEVFHSQGQEVFSDVTKYRSSVGWDLRDKFPKFALTNAAITKVASLPAPKIIVDIAGLYDDFALGTLGKWTISSGAKIVCLADCVDYVTRDSDRIIYFDHGYAMCGGLHNSTWGVFDGYAEAAQTNAYGAWSADICAPLGDSVGALDTNYCEWRFIMDGSDNYYRMRIYSTNASMVSLTRADAGSETVLATAAINSIRSRTGASSHFTITRNAAGEFVIKQDGVAKITHIDNTHTVSTKMQIRLGTYTDVKLWDDAIDWSGICCFIDNVSIPTTELEMRATTGKTVAYNNEIWVAYKTAAAAFTITKIVEGATSTNTPTIYHINASDIEVISRNGACSGGTTNQNTFLAAVNGGGLRIIEGVATVSTIALGAYDYTCIVQFLRDTILCLGTSGEYTGKIVCTQVIFGAGVWTTTQISALGDGNGTATQGAIPPYGDLDSDATVHFTTCDADDEVGRIPSRIFRSVSTDLGTTHVGFSSIKPLENFQSRGCAALGGVIYIFGAKIENGMAYDCAMKIDGTEVYRSEYGIALEAGTTAQRLNFGIKSLYLGLTSVLFMTKSNDDSGALDIICELGINGSVREVACFSAGTFGYAALNPVGIAEWNGKFIAISPKADAVYAAGPGRGSQSLFSGFGYLHLSEFGGNTPLINKTLYKVRLELSSALTASNTITVQIDKAGTWTDVGIITAAMGTSVELTPTTEFTMGKFDIRLKYDSTHTWTGSIKRFSIQYVSTQFKKRAWAFGVRCDRNLKLIDGTRDTRTPIAMFGALENAWASNMPVAFVDVDGTPYTILVTDYDQRRPVVHNDRNREESFVFLELLEV